MQGLMRDSDAVSLPAVCLELASENPESLRGTVCANHADLQAHHNAIILFCDWLIVCGTSVREQSINDKVRKD